MASVVEPLDEHVDHVRGEAGAPLILEYGDYECPYSRQAFRSIERVERDLECRVRFAFRHYPLTQIHPHALAASATRGGDEARSLLGDARPAVPPAEGSGRRRPPCLSVTARIAPDVASGDATGLVRGTPTIFIDGVLYEGGYDPAAFVEALPR